jgi:hypothetical protein
MVCRKFLMGPSKNLVSSWRGYVNISIVFSPKHQFMTPLLYIYSNIFFIQLGVGHSTYKWCIHCIAVYRQWKC